MAYECLYCGKKIEPDEILFVDETSIPYEDPIRDAFFRRCGMIAGEGIAKFQRLYHRVNSENVQQRDENGFPFTITYRRCDGLTADELTQLAGNAPVQTVTETVENVPENNGFGTDTYEGFGGMENAAVVAPAANVIVKPTSEEIEILATRACPHCHCDLPQEFGLLPVYSVQILGGRASGKTAFLICLHQQLNRQMSMYELGTADLLDESRLYLDPKVLYYEENGTPQPTKRIQKIFPLVYHITAKYQATEKEAFVCFHDVAGEGMANANYLHNLAGLGRSRNLLYIIDPNQLNSGGYYKAYNQLVQRQVAAGNRQDALFNDALATGENMDFYQTDLSLDINKVGRMVTGVLGDKKPNNIFVVMTKMDMPLMVEQQMFGKGKLHMMFDIGTTHKRIIDGDVLNKIDSDINKFVAAKTNSASVKRLTESITAAFDCDESLVHVCGISTHTRVQPPQNWHIWFDNRNTAEAPKHRIIEPFLSILYHIGLLPARFVEGNRETINWCEDPEAKELIEQNASKQKGNKHKDSKKKQRKGIFG